eukprot:CAMPEP_0182822824 /NCGR_PEP_ID=MMETSP0006_2-20121128/14417_1 /TAXON_ID=97485 /ORGANISM="Prymnesium parvum, Strain Texoma1" /LENGTH=99 /DNA_ID=CAMNT_0024949689 /DNA_START=248 /DNA_END=544 /DNA_ORIENTATION=+
MSSCDNGRGACAILCVCPAAAAAAIAVALMQARAHSLRRCSSASAERRAGVSRGSSHLRAGHGARHGEQSSAHSGEDGFPHSSSVVAAPSNGRGRPGGG